MNWRYPTVSVHHPETYERLDYLSPSVANADDPQWAAKVQIWWFAKNRYNVRDPFISYREGYQRVVEQVLAKNLWG